jgi:hypothetical protein
MENLCLAGEKSCQLGSQSPTSSTDRVIEGPEMNYRLVMDDHNPRANRGGALKIKRTEKVRREELYRMREKKELCGAPY